MIAQVIFHMIKPDMELYRGKVTSAIYPAIWDAVQARGARPQIVERGEPETRGKYLAADGNVHIVEFGNCTGPGWFCGATAYLAGFWHLGDRGVLADRPAGQSVYDPELVPGQLARQFDRVLRARFVATRQSRYGQRKLKVQILPEDALAVFLQGPAVYWRKQAFVPGKAMVRAVAENAGGRAVVVKPHPQSKEMGQKIITELRAEGVDLIETDANVHDILKSCAATVSVNSAAAIEGFLHRKPAILFGRSDFHTLCQTAASPQDFPPALDRALAARPDYARMLYWYFSENTLEVAAPDFEPRLFAHLARSGFDARALGI